MRLGLACLTYCVLGSQPDTGHAKDSRVLIQWDVIATFGAVAILGGFAALAAHWHRCLSGRVRYRARWFGFVALCNGITLSLACALVIDRQDHSTKTAILTAIVAGAMSGWAGPDWILSWLVSILDVMSEARKKAADLRRAKDDSGPTSTDDSTKPDGGSSA